MEAESWSGAVGYLPLNPGEINNIIVAGGSGTNTLHFGPGILGLIPVFFSTHGNAVPFVINKNQLTIQGDQLGAPYDDVISMSQFGAGGVQATENGDTVQFDPGEINSIQVNLLAVN